MVIFPGEFAGSPLDSPSPYTIPPCPAQTAEGMAVKDQEWREITFHVE